MAALGAAICKPYGNGKERSTGNQAHDGLDDYH